METGCEGHHTTDFSKVSPTKIFQGLIFRGHRLSKELPGPDDKQIITRGRAEQIQDLGRSQQGNRPDPNGTPQPQAEAFLAPPQARSTSTVDTGVCE